MKAKLSELLPTIVTLWLARFAALFDASAWLLILPCALWLYVKDAPLMLSVVQWSAFYFVIAGMAVVISRIAFPQIKLGDFIGKAMRGSVSAAIVVASVVWFVGWMSSALATWARPVSGG